MNHIITTKGAAVVVERSGALRHGQGGPRFESRRGRIFSWTKNHKSLADSENGWMDARARSRARTRVADAQDCLFRSDREKDRFFTLLLNTDTITSDFEEHLAIGVGKNASFALKFGLWLCIVKKRTSCGIKR